MQSALTSCAAVPRATGSSNSRGRASTSRLQVSRALQTEQNAQNNPPSTSQRTVDSRYSDFLNAWDRTFMDVDACPDGYLVTDVEGEIPRDLSGTLYRNGPNDFAKVDHPYDADGFLASLTFEDGRAFFRSRFVETAERVADRDCDRAVFRGTFLTQRREGNFGDLHVKNTSNTNVIEYAGRVFTFWEAGQPYELDPKTLETVGISSFAGTTPTGLPFDLDNKFSNTVMGAFVRLAQKLSGDELLSSQDEAPVLPETLTNAGGWAMTAHPKICPRTGRLVTFSYTMRIGVLDPSDVAFPPMYSQIRFMEFDDTDRPPKAERTVKLPGYCFLHDFAITDDHYVVFINPVTVDSWSYMSGESPAAGSVRWIDGKPTIILCIPRDATKPMKSFTMDPCFVFHHAGAFVDGNDLVVDSIHYPSLPSVGKEASPKQGLDPNAAFQSRLKRVRVQDWQSEGATVTVEQLFDDYLEMVSTNPRVTRHRYVYGYASCFERALIGVARIDTETKTAETWSPEDRQFLLEPIFVPMAGDTGDEADGDGDGWVIAQFIDSDTGRTGFFIFDSADIPRGPVARVWLNQALPSALHGCWSSATFFD